jgi:inosine-uridine nucleoside N-ribohydrolase
MALVSPKKVIIDTDPGIDDAMAILFAFQSPELDVIGLTTTYGNVKTTMATNNALHLVWRSSSLSLSLSVSVFLLSNLSCFCNSSYIFALRV